ncbi:MAG: hypothetical protein WKG52_14205 [Variovorax sp.]
MKQASVVRLGDICRQDRITIKPGEREDLRYVGLESIEAGTGRLQHNLPSKPAHAPRANSFRFDEGHVLYGKLRPYLNKVALPDAEGKCSTEIVPLRPCADVDRRFLAYFLRAPQTAARIAARSSAPACRVRTWPTFSACRCSCTNATRNCASLRCCRAPKASCGCMARPSARRRN